MRLRALAFLAVAFCSHAICARADVAWPADFWTQITNSMAIPSGSQISAGAGGTFSVSAPAGDAATGGDLGSAEHPFDSRVTTSEASNATALYSGPVGLIITFR